jgi:hypothetical protein
VYVVCVFCVWPVRTAVVGVRVAEVERVAVDVGSEVATGWSDVIGECDGDEKRYEDEETHSDGFGWWRGYGG